MFFPVIGKRLVEFSILFLADVVWITSPDRLCFVKFFIFGVFFLKLNMRYEYIQKFNFRKNTPKMKNLTKQSLSGLVIQTTSAKKSMENSTSLLPMTGKNI
jgi:hypothetical protein